MTISGQVPVWAEPIKRNHLQLVEGDIKKAIAWSMNTRSIILNPKNEHLAGEAPDNINIAYLEGCLTWEVWLSTEDSFIVSSPEMGVATESISHSSNSKPMESPTDEEKRKMSILNSKPVSMLKFKPRGRPERYKKRELPEDEIRELYATGLGANAISTKLRKEKNIVISRATIQRVLSGERGHL